MGYWWISNRMLLLRLLLIGAAARSAPVISPNSRIFMEIADRRGEEDTDLGDKDESNYVSQLISSLKNFMNYFSERLPRGDFKNIKCELVTEKDKETFIFHEVEGKIFPNKKHNYENKSKTKFGGKKYVEISLVDNEADGAFGTVYLFPQVAVNPEEENTNNNSDHKKPLNELKNYGEANVNQNQAIEESKEVDYTSTQSYEHKNMNNKETLFPFNFIYRDNYSLINTKSDITLPEESPPDTSTVEDIITINTITEQPNRPTTRQYSARLKDLADSYPTIPERTITDINDYIITLPIYEHSESYATEVTPLYSGISSHTSPSSYNIGGTDNYNKNRESTKFSPIIASISTESKVLLDTDEQKNTEIATERLSKSEPGYYNHDLYSLKTSHYTSVTPFNLHFLLRNVSDNDMISRSTMKSTKEDGLTPSMANQSNEIAQLTTNRDNQSISLISDQISEVTSLRTLKDTSEDSQITPQVLDISNYISSLGIINYANENNISNSLNAIKKTTEHSQIAYTIDGEDHSSINVANGIMVNTSLSTKKGNTENKQTTSIHSKDTNEADPLSSTEKYNINSQATTMVSETSNERATLNINEVINVNSQISSMGPEIISEMAIWSIKEETNIDSQTTSMAPSISNERTLSNIKEVINVNNQTTTMVAEPRNESTPSNIKEVIDVDSQISSMAPDISSERTPLSIKEVIVVDSQISSMAPDISSERTPLSIKEVINVDSQISSMAPDITSERTPFSIKEVINVDSQISSMAPDISSERTPSNIKENINVDSQTFSMAPDISSERTLSSIKEVINVDSQISSMAPDISSERTPLSIKEVINVDSQISSMAPDIISERAPLNIKENVNVDSQISSMTPDISSERTPLSIKEVINVDSQTTSMASGTSNEMTRFETIKGNNEENYITKMDPLITVKSIYGDSQVTSIESVNKNDLSNNTLNRNSEDSQTTSMFSDGIKDLSSLATRVGSDGLLTTLIGSSQNQEFDSLTTNDINYRETNRTAIDLNKNKIFAGNMNTFTPSVTDGAYGSFLTSAEDTASEYSDLQTILVPRGTTVTDLFHNSRTTDQMMTTNDSKSDTAIRNISENTIIEDITSIGPVNFITDFNATYASIDTSGNYAVTNRFPLPSNISDLGLINNLSELKKFVNSSTISNISISHFIENISKPKVLDEIISTSQNYDDLMTSKAYSDTKYDVETLINRTDIFDIDSGKQYSSLFQEQTYNVEDTIDINHSSTTIMNNSSTRTYKNDLDISTKEVNYSQLNESDAENGTNQFKLTTIPINKIPYNSDAKRNSTAKVNSFESINHLDYSTRSSNSGLNIHSTSGNDVEFKIDIKTTTPSISPDTDLNNALRTEPSTGSTLFPHLNSSNINSFNFVFNGSNKSLNGGKTLSTLNSFYEITFNKTENISTVVTPLTDDTDTMDLDSIRNQTLPVKVTQFSEPQASMTDQNKNTNIYITTINNYYQIKESASLVTNSSEFPLPEIIDRTTFTPEMTSDSTYESYVGNITEETTENASEVSTFKLSSVPMDKYQQQPSGKTTVSEGHEQVTKEEKYETSLQEVDKSTGQASIDSNRIGKALQTETLETKSSANNLTSYVQRDLSGGISSSTLTDNTFSFHANRERMTSPLPYFTSTESTTKDIKRPSFEKKEIINGTKDYVNKTHNSKTNNQFQVSSPIEELKSSSKSVESSLTPFYYTTNTYNSSTLLNGYSKSESTTKDSIAQSNDTGEIHYDELGFNNFTFSLPSTEHRTVYIPLRLYTIKPLSEIH